MQPTDNVTFTYEQVQALGDKIKSGSSAQGYWGDLTYYSEWAVEWSAESADECIVNSIDGDKLDAFIAEYGREWENDRANFDYEDGNWQFWGEEGRIEIPAAEMLSRTGIDVAVNDGSSWAYMELQKGITVDTESETTTKTLKTKAEFYGLTEKQNDQFNVGELIPASAVKAFSFSQDNLDFTSIPSNFLSSCSNLETINFSIPHSQVLQIGNSFGSSNSKLASVAIPSSVKQIGDSFLAWCGSLASLNGTSNLTEIGDSFLSGCTTFNSSLSLSNVTKVGHSFLSGCTAFNSTVSLGRAEEVGNDFMMNCSSWNSTNTWNTMFGYSSTYIKKIGNNFMRGCTAASGLYIFTSYQQANPGLDIEEVGNYFCYGCTGMTVSPIDSAKKVGEYFLAGCTGISNIQLKNCESLGSHAFDGCTALSTLSLLGSTFEKRFAGDYLAYNCDSLSSVSIEGALVDSTAFTNTSFATTNPNASSYLNGITLTFRRDTDINQSGQNRLIGALAQSDASPFRRVSLTFLPARNILRLNKIMNPVSTSYVDISSDLESGDQGSVAVMPGLTVFVDPQGNFYRADSYQHSIVGQTGSYVDVIPLFYPSKTPKRSSLSLPDSTWSTDVGQNVTLTQLQIDFLAAEGIGNGDVIQTQDGNTWRVIMSSSSGRLTLQSRGVPGTRTPAVGLTTFPWLWYNMGNALPTALSSAPYIQRGCLGVYKDANNVWHLSVYTSKDANDNIIWTQIV